MTHPKLDLQTVLSEIRAEFPSFKLLPKSQSRLMKIIGSLLGLIGMKTFMTSYITTIGTTIYTHSHWEQTQDIHKASVLRHERMHLRQCKKYGLLLWAFLYLFFPLPFGLAYYRAKFEKEGYKESMRAAYWIGGSYALLQPKYKQFILDQFLTNTYGWMWPFRSSMEEWYNKTMAEILIEENSPTTPQ